MMLIVGVACAIVFVSVNGEMRPPADGGMRRWVVGLKQSPWFVYENGPRGFRMYVEFFSASWLFLAAAVGLLSLRGMSARSDAQASKPEPADAV
jgi:hypothetical protein